MKNSVSSKPLFILLTAAAIVVTANPLYAAEQQGEAISWTFIIIGLLGGLAFFLYGMEKMSEGLRKSAGNKMRSILATLTQNRIIALFVGAFVTMVIQSSSATTVMLVSFVQAELMTFTQSLGVILGADIGTTITAQMVAFKLTDYALAMIAAGFGLRMFGKSENLKSIGDILLGFGILFYGMKLMSDSMKPLRTYPQFIDMMKTMENPFMGILVGAMFTALVQSSSATTGVVIVLAQQGLISLDGGIPLILGANIGTCVTAGLASIGTQREAKRVALAHVLFKIAGVMLIFPLIHPFADMIRSIAGRFDSGTARQIANAHTIFNVGIGLFFLPFVDLFSRLILRLMPTKEKEKGIEPVTWHLDDSLVSTPALALELANSEIARMAKILGRMHNASIIPFVSTETPRDEIYPEQLSLLEGIAMREKKINFLEEKTRVYLLKITRQQLVEGQGREVNGLLSLLDVMESIGDVIVKQVVPLVKKKEAAGADFSKAGKEELITYHKKVGKQLGRLKQMMTKMDASLAQKMTKKKSSYVHFDSDLRQFHMKRMMEMKEETVETHGIHMELLDALNQINNYSAEIAKIILRNDLLAGSEEANGEDGALAMS